uniref:Uncharacterized protein n=1 Tax=Panagrolaimus sp. ES5 TaxID=591445 RepID=A0AC34F0G2_9BILA
MPLIHKENCAFSSFDCPKLETSIAKLSEKAIKHMSDAVRSDESFRRHRRKPLTSSSLNQPTNMPLKNKNLKITDNDQSALKKTKKVAVKSPLKSLSPLTKVGGKRNNGSVVIKNLMKESMECLPSTSHSTTSKDAKNKNKIDRLDVKNMFKFLRPEFSEFEEYTDDKDNYSIPPFIKYQQVFEIEEEDEHFDQKKQKIKNDPSTSTKREIYDAAPIREMRRGFQYKAEKEAFCVESTTKWFARWNEPIQVENTTIKSHTGASRYESSFSKTFKNLIVQRKFKMPDNLISAGISEENSLKNFSKIYSFAYKMDEIDLCWLDVENCQRLLAGKLPMDSNTFSHIIDTFEVDCYTTIWKLLLQQISASRRFFDEPQHAACDICYTEECESEDNIIFCEGCETVVHQCCYGIDSLPSDSWLCDVCLTDSESPTCLLCPLHNGAMKKDSCNNGFVHVSCALWIPEVTFEDADHRENIIISKVKDNRFAATCEVCGLVKGACLFCSADDCNAAYHVTCGQRAGYMFRMESEPDLEFISFCHTHTIQNLPPNTIIINKYVRSMPMKTAKDLEQFFASYTDINNEKLVTAYGNEVVECIFDYWKLKRLDKGSPLILPSDIKNSMIPQFKEIASKPNEILLRKEPRDTRMAADNMRTLLWMTSERESRKLESLQSSQDLLSSILNDIQNGKIDDEQIDNAIQLVSDMNIGESTNADNSTTQQSGIIECVVLNTELDVKSENYIPKIQKHNIKPITSYRSQIKNDTNEFDGLDFDDGDIDSPIEESSENEISNDEEEANEDQIIFLNKPGESFRGQSTGQPTAFLDEKSDSPQDIVALIFN